MKIEEMKKGLSEFQLNAFNDGRAFLNRIKADANTGRLITSMVTLSDGWTPEKRQDYIQTVFMSFGEGNVKSPAGVAYSSYSKRINRAAEKAGYAIPEGTVERNTGTDTYTFPLHLEKLPAKKDSSKDVSPTSGNVTEPDTGTPVQPKAKTNPVQYAQGIVDAIPSDLTLYALIKAMAGNLDHRQIANLSRYCDKVLTADANSEDNTVEADKVA